MGRILAALLPPTNGGVGCLPVLPHSAARQARKAAEIVGLLAVTWLLVDLPLLWAGAAVIAGGASLLVLRFPWLVWPGLAVALPFASGIEIGPLSMADGLLAAAVFSWFVDGVRKNRLRLNMGFLPGLFILYLLALLLSFHNAINLQKAVEGVIKWSQMLVAVLLIQEALTSRQVRWLIWGLLAGGALQAAIGMYQFVFRIGPPSFLLLDRFMRAAGTFGQPNPFAGYLGLTLPVAVALFLHFFSSIAKRKSSFSVRPLAWTAVYGSVAGVIGLGNAGELEPGRLAGRSRKHLHRPAHPQRPDGRRRCARRGLSSVAGGRQFTALHSHDIVGSIGRSAGLFGAGHVGGRTAADYQ